ncbi:hypothetical protein [Butyricicoccus sp.]|uniref:hypothetical protein n=1 Tax=Butyricicoccus sp. TaxID=2049021 RepID=UPI00373689E2
MSCIHIQWTDWYLWLLLALFEIPAIVANRCTLRAIHRHEVGYTTAFHLYRKQPKWKRFFYCGVKQNLQHRRVIFTLFQWKLWLLYVLLVFTLLGYEEQLDTVSSVALFGSIGSMGLDLLMSQCFDPTYPDGIKEEDEAVVDVSLDYIKAKEAYEQARRAWLKADTPKEKKKRLKKLASKAEWLELEMVEYYHYDIYRKDKEKRRQDIRFVRNAIEEVERESRKLELITDSETMVNSELMPDARAFRQEYAEAKQKLMQADTPKKKREKLEWLADVVNDFANRLGDQYVENQNIDSDNREEFDEAVALVMQSVDEIEAFQKEIQSPEIEPWVAGLYDAMHANGLLPKERENRFPERMREGEIHRIYEYDS